MKKISLFLLLLLATVIIYPQTPETPVGSVPESGWQKCAEKRIHSPNLPEGWLTEANLPHSYDALHYALDLDIYNCFISPYPKSFKASVTITLRADSVITNIQLNAVNTSIQIDSVRMAAVSVNHTGNIALLTLDRTYTPGETLQVKIYYQHKNVTDNAFYVSNGFVFTDCEPEGARKWFPCWDKPSDKATMELRARVPATVKLGSNGRLADSVKTGDTIYYHWVSRDPVATYLFVISAKVNYNLDIVNWVHPTNPAKNFPIRFYYNSGENVANAKNLIVPMTNFFTSIYGDHPFEKNGFATLNSQFSWGGMENQSLTSLCPGCWSEMLLAHEYAHQWFGDMITCATWADIFLNEGFATFSESLWLEHTGGPSAYKSDVLSNASSYMNSNPGWAISNPAWAVTTPGVNTLFNTAITYSKGAVVLHLLRYAIGDAAFFAGMRQYAEDVQVKYKSAVIADFQAVMSQASGQDLSWFFNQWIFQPNHPLYANKYWITTAGQNQWQVGFIGKQTQTNTVFFKMPIEIKVTFQGGTDTTMRVFHESNDQMFTFIFNRQPLSVSFDPNNQIVIKTASLTVTDPIPVEFVSFTHRVIENTVQLDWKTASEVNNSGFSVELSFNGKDWSEIGFVEGKGSYAATTDYRYIDYADTYGIRYYRLKQVDFDGTFDYSNVIETTAGLRPEKIVLHPAYPNPFNPASTITFELPVAMKITLTLYDAAGQKIYTAAEGIYNEGFHSVIVRGDQLTSGTYFAELIAGDTAKRIKLLLIK